MTRERSSAVAVFRGLHSEGLLVLPNAWDAGTARLIENAGARAIATSSAAVAWSHGWPDGDVLPVPLLLATVGEIVRAVTVPVTVDVEGGYSAEPDRAAEVVGAVIDAGGVGINIEDGNAEPDLLCRKIERAKSASARRGVELFVNARTDVYLKNLVPEERRVEESVARGERYRAAGADGIFVPGVTRPDEIRAIAAAVPLPLNVLARPGLPPARELRELGARRLSAGSWIASHAYGRIAAVAAEFLRTGDSTALFSGALPYADVNALMSPP